MTTDATPAALRLIDKLGLLPERDGQPRVYTATGPVPEAGHWYSPTAVREMLAAERDRMNRHAVTLAETARLVEQERCAKLCRRLRSLDGDFLARAIENESSVNWPR